MQLRPTALLATAVLVLATSTAGAVEVAFESPSSVTIAPGGYFTIELSIDNASMTSVNGIVVDIIGLAGVANVISGVSSAGYFYGFCGATCYGGIPTNDNLFFDHTDLSAGTYHLGDDSVRVVQAVNVNDVTATGVIDPGVNGVIGVHDPTDVSIVLQRLAFASTPLVVSSSFSSAVNGVTVLPDLVFSFGVIPELGTALLLGFGLAGLATAGRRNRTIQAGPTGPGRRSCVFS